MEAKSPWVARELFCTAVKPGQGVWRYHLETEIVLCKILLRHRNLLFSKKWPKESDRRGLLIWEGRGWKGVVGEGQQLTFYSVHKTNVSPFLLADS